jgi:hypothetical protein
MAKTKFSPLTSCPEQQAFWVIHFIRGKQKFYNGDFSVIKRCKISKRIQDTIFFLVKIAPEKEIHKTML